MIIQWNHEILEPHEPGGRASPRALFSVGVPSSLGSRGRSPSPAQVCLCDMRMRWLLSVAVTGAVMLALCTGAHAAPTFRITGTVVDIDGRPVAGAVVESYHAGYRGPFGITDIGAHAKAKGSVTTGSNGAFGFPLSPYWTYLVARKPGLAAAWICCVNPTKDVLDRRLVLTPPATLAGVVVDGANKPVADVEVWVSAAYNRTLREDGNTIWEYLSGKPARDLFSTRTKTDGRFVVQGFPTNAVADLVVSRPGKAPRGFRRQFASPDTMGCRAGQQDIRLVAESSGSIEGKVVVQETGQPLPGMGLWLKTDEGAPGFDNPANAWLEPTESAADGTFRFGDLAPGRYRIGPTYGTNPVPEWVAEAESVVVQSGQTNRDLVISASRGGLLEVSVLSKHDRKPVADACVNALGGGFTVTADSAANGIALLRLLPREYRISVHSTNGCSEDSPATVEGGRTNRIEVVLKPPVRITGVLRDPSGAAVPGFQLAVFPEPALSPGEIKTDSQGRYRLTLDPQLFDRSQPTLRLVACDVARNLVAAQDIEGSSTTLDLQLQPGLAIAGRVEDVNGNPLSNATVQVSVSSGNLSPEFGDKPARTDAYGRFEFTTLPAGWNYRLYFKAQGYGVADQSVEGVTDTNRAELPPVVLKRADRRLAGKVLDQDEKPVAKVRVYMQGEGQVYRGVETDDHGWFRFDGVCEGMVEVSLSVAQGYGHAWVEAGDTNVVIRLGARPKRFYQETSKRPSLKGQPLPDLAAAGFNAEAVPVGKPVLLCLFDFEQRPSRRFLGQLIQQHDALRQKGLTLLGLQAAVTTAERFKEWKDANPVPFSVGRVAQKTYSLRWASEVETLPWLILTDADRQVTAEGFALDELDAKLEPQAKP